MEQPEYRKHFYRQYLKTVGGGYAAATLEDAPRGLRDFFTHIIDAHFPADRRGKIVELGCGIGLLVHLARKAGFSDVTGVENSPEIVAEAARLGIDDIVLDDAVSRLKTLEPVSLDAVVCIDFIEHLTRDELVVLATEVHRVLKPGGRWIVHTVNAEAPFFGRIRYGDLTHEQGFTRSSIRQLALSSDFTEIRCYEDAPIPGRPAATLRWLMWKIARLPALFWLVAESGPAARHAILSQNLLAVAIR